MNRKQRKTQQKTSQIGGKPTPPNTIGTSQLLNQAVQHHQRGLLTEAKALYRRVLTTDPGQADPLHLLGLIEHQVGRNDIAIDMIGRAITINRETAFYYSNLGNLFKSIGRLERAVASYGTALLFKPDFAEAHTNLGNALKDLGQNNEAVVAYRSALRVKPDLVEAHSNLGNALKDLGQIKTSVAAYKAALCNKPDYFEALSNMGVILKDLGLVSNAISAYKAALHLKPDYYQAHSNLGNALKSEGRLDEAMACYCTALRINASYSEGYSNLAVALKDLRRFDNAIIANKAALCFKPEYAEAHSNLGNTLYYLERLNEAIQSYGTALRLKPDYTVAYSNLGNALHHIDHFDDAILAYHTALCIRPDYADAHSNLGNTLYQLNRLDEAFAAYTTALRIKPDFTEALSNLGNSLKDLGRLDEAVVAFCSALRIKPDYAEAHYNLGGTLYELGQQDKSIAAFSVALCNKPDYGEALLGLGGATREIAQFERMNDACRRASISKSIKPSKVGREPVDGTNITALLPVGRSGSLFFHSLFDGHPALSTLPGVYFKGWFSPDVWRLLCPNASNQNWRAELVQRILETFEPLFDAGSRKNVPGKPFGDSDWLAAESGFMAMGPNQSTKFTLDRNAFAGALLERLAAFSAISSGALFDLIHQAFDTAIRRHPPKEQIFYHIHNPDPFEMGNFLGQFPRAKLLYLFRNPIQAMESWLLHPLLAQTSKTNADNGPPEAQMILISKALSIIVSRIFEMFSLPQMCFLPAIRAGIRLEDIKRSPQKVMPQIASWMGIGDDPSLYESNFCGLQYWGPHSPATGAITGFSTKSLEQPMGRLLGPRDLVIFDTLFWPISRRYGYSDASQSDFRARLLQIRPWLAEPLELEKHLWRQLNQTWPPLEEVPAFHRLHRFLNALWHRLDRDGDFSGLVEPLPLD